MIRTQFFLKWIFETVLLFYHNSVSKPYCTLCTITNSFTGNYIRTETEIGSRQCSAQERRLGIFFCFAQALFDLRSLFFLSLATTDSSQVIQKNLSLVQTKNLTMLVLAFSKTILLLATVGSSVVADLSPVPQQQHFREAAAKPEDAKNTGNETVDLVPIRSLLPMNGAAMLDSSNKAGTCKDQTSTAGFTTRTCTTTIAGFKVQSIYGLNANGVYNKVFCMTVAGIPCKDSNFCTFPDGTFGNFQSVDCRNTALGNSKKTCGTSDCQGKCLPKINYVPSFANGINGCSFLIDLNYIPYATPNLPFAEDASFVDILGDGKIVFVQESHLYPNSPQCTASINGKSCTSCTTCSFNLPSLVNYDCSNLSNGPCAKKVCSACADKKNSLTKDATTVATKEASAEETATANQTLAFLTNASSGVVAKATVPANSTPTTTSATSSVLATAPSAAGTGGLASALAGAVWLMAIY
jgi:hypothetical protein